MVRTGKPCAFIRLRIKRTPVRLMGARLRETGYHASGRQFLPSGQPPVVNSKEQLNSEYPLGSQDE